jgi:hypothetical protein
VEALRGVLIEPKRGPTPTPDATPVTEPTPAPTQNQVHPVAPEPVPLDPLFLPPSNLRLRAMTFLAPTAGLDAGLHATLGGAVNLLIGVDNFAVGAGVQRLFYASEVHADAGKATLERQHVSGIVQGHLDLSPKWEAFAEFQAGVVSYAVAAEAAAGFAATRQTHSDLAVGGGVGLTHWMFDYVGWFVRTEALFLPTPIRVRMDDHTVATLGLPAATLSIGIAAQLH